MKILKYENGKLIINEAASEALQPHTQSSALKSHDSQSEKTLFKTLSTQVGEKQNTVINKAKKQQKKWSLLNEADIKNQVYETAISLLAIREHSEEELKQKLRRKMLGQYNQSRGALKKKVKQGNSIQQELEESQKDDKIAIFEKAFDMVITQLKENAYQSDERFVQSYIRAKKIKGVGPLKIELELKQKGISGYLIEQYLDKHDTEWLQIAKQVYKKKFSDKKMTGKAEWAKRARFLVSRGFYQSQVYQIVEKLDY